LALGRAGENRAATWYLEHGFDVVDRNWRSRQGEIDIVARKGRLLVFCEVKTRTSQAFGEPFEAVTRAKQLRLRRLAAEWLRQSGSRARSHNSFEVRFDVASLLGGRLEILEGAF
jgi:putative endonuclease